MKRHREMCYNLPEWCPSVDLKRIKQRAWDRVHPVRASYRMATEAYSTAASPGTVAVAKLGTMPEFWALLWQAVVEWVKIRARALFRGTRQ